MEAVGDGLSVREVVVLIREQYKLQGLYKILVTWRD